MTFRHPDPRLGGRLRTLVVRNGNENHIVPNLTSYKVLQGVVPLPRRVGGPKHGTVHKGVKRGSGSAVYTVVLLPVHVSQVHIVHSDTTRQDGDIGDSDTTRQDGDTGDPDTTRQDDNV